MVMGVDVFESYDAARAGALADYYRYARDNDLYLTYVIINPQADRSKGPSEQHDRFLTAGVVDQDAEGLTIRGGKMLATGGVFANEVFVTCIQPLREGEEAYAISLAVADEFEGAQEFSPDGHTRKAQPASSTIRSPAASTRTTRFSTSTTSRSRGTESSSIKTSPCAKSNSMRRRPMSTRTTSRRSG